MKTIYIKYKVEYLENAFFKYYSNTLGLAICLDWMFIPYFTKLLGSHIAVAFITLYYLLSEASGYFEHWFDNMELVSSIRLLILLDFLQVLVYLVYFIDVTYMLYGLMFMFSIQAMFYEILNVKIIKYHENKSLNFSSIQKLLLLNKSTMVFIGLFISLIYSLFIVDISYLIICIIVLMFISLYNEFKLLTFLKD